MGTKDREDSAGDDALGGPRNGGGAAGLGPAARIAKLNRSALEPEHQALLDVVLADVGMEDFTREELIEHLLEEEDPRLLRALHRARAGETSPENAARAARVPGLTVGSLRPRDERPPPRRGTVGPLDRG